MRRGPVRFISLLILFSMRISETLGKWVGHYRCAAFRKGCKACVTMTILDAVDDAGGLSDDTSSNDGEEDDSTEKRRSTMTMNSESHTCPKQFQRRLPEGSDNVVVTFATSDGGTVLCIKDEMKQVAQDLALSDTKMSSIRIAQTVLDRMERIYDTLPFKGLNAPQLQSIVHYTRRKEFADWEGAIASFPMVLCSDDDDRLFLQFNASLNLNDGLQKVIGWAHPDLIHLTKYGEVNTFIDCTFSCVPKGFEQCLIIMVYDRSTCMYVPVFYVLLQSKLEKAYFHALQLCISATDWKFEAKTVTCDFEQGLLSAVEANFPSTPVVGCVFHWKQALRRKLLAYRIPKDMISELMSADGLINVLTHCPIEDIEVKAVPYIRDKFHEGDYKANFDSFWKYFLDTWMKLFKPEHWNINAYSQNSDDVINRTNNPLERFNRKLKNAFPVAHPSMAVFVNTIKDLSVEYVSMLERIKRRTLPPPRHAPLTLIPLPDDYENYISAKNVAGTTTLMESTQLHQFQWLIGTTHYDPEDRMMFRVVGLRSHKQGREKYIVGDRLQVPCKNHSLRNGVQPFKDFISVEEIVAYTNVSGSSDPSPRATKRTKRN